MGDIFKEQLVPMKMGKNERAQIIIIWTVAILASVTLFLVLPPFIAPIVVLALIWGAVYLAGKQKKEHEYSLTNQYLDIDVIYNKEKRKRLIEVDLKKMNVMASIKDEKHADELSRAQKTINASDNELTKETYAIVFPKDGENVKILITPNEDMLNLMYKQAPNKVFKYRG